MRTITTNNIKSSATKPQFMIREKYMYFGALFFLVFGDIVLLKQIRYILELDLLINQVLFFLRQINFQLKKTRIII